MIQDNKYCVRSDNVVLKDGVKKAYICINQGIIEQILEDTSNNENNIKNILENYRFYDYGNQYISPGVIDTNFYMNCSHDDLFDNDINIMSKIALMGGVTMIVNQPIMTNDENKNNKQYESQSKFGSTGSDISIKINYQNIIQKLKNDLVVDFGQLGLLEPQKQQENINKIQDLDINNQSNQKYNKKINENINMENNFEGNINSQEIIDQHTQNNGNLIQNLDKLLGLKIYLSPSLQNGVQYFKSYEDLYKSIQIINNNKTIFVQDLKKQINMPIFIHPSLQKTDKDILITSPMRKQNIKMRSINIYDNQQFGLSVDAVQGETGELLKLTKKEFNLYLDDSKDSEYYKVFLKTAYENTDDNQTTLLAKEELKNYSNQQQNDNENDLQDINKGKLPEILEILDTDNSLTQDIQKLKDEKEKKLLQKCIDDNIKQMNKLNDNNKLRDRGMTLSTLQQEELKQDQINPVKNKIYKNNNQFIDQYDQQESDGEEEEEEEKQQQENQENLNDMYQDSFNYNNQGDYNNSHNYLHKANSGSPLKISKFNNQNKSLKIVPEIDEHNNSQSYQKKNQQKQLSVDVQQFNLDDSLKNNSGQKIDDLASENDSGEFQNVQKNNQKNNEENKKGLQIKSRFGNKPSLTIKSPIKNRINNKLEKLSINIQGDVGSTDLIDFSEDEEDLDVSDLIDQNQNSQEKTKTNHIDNKPQQLKVFQGDDLLSPSSIRDIAITVEQPQQNNSIQEIQIQDHSEASRKRSQMNLLAVSNNSSSNNNELRKRSTSSLFERRMRVNSAQSDFSSDQDKNQRQKANSLRKITHKNNNSKMQKVEQQDSYQSFLAYRPAYWEHFAINFIRNYQNFNNKQLQNKQNNNLVFQNIGNSYSLAKIKGLKNAQKQEGFSDNLYCEVSSPYLSFDSNFIQNEKEKGAQYKNEPAIQDIQNKKLLISALIKSDLVDTVGSYNLYVPELFKYKKYEKFKRSFNGFFSVGTNLPVVWSSFNINIKNQLNNNNTNDQEQILEKQNECILKISKILSEKPAEILNIQNLKGQIEVGKDADFIVWDPNDVKRFQVKDLYFQNNNNKYKSHIYNRRKLYGVVNSTFIRGHEVFKRSEKSLLFSKNFKPRLVIQESREEQKRNSEILLFQSSGDISSKSNSKNQLNKSQNQIQLNKQ